MVAAEKQHEVYGISNVTFSYARNAYPAFYTVRRFPPKSAFLLSCLLLLNVLHAVSVEALEEAMVDHHIQELHQSYNAGADQ